VLYKPSGGIAGASTLWASAWARARTALPSAIVLDDLAGESIIPAGAWDMRGIDLRSLSGQIPTLTIADGATLPNLCDVRGIVLSSVSTAPVIALASGFLALTLDRQASLQASAAPFIRTTGAAFLSLGLRYFSYIINAGNKVLDCQAGSTALIFADFAGQIYANTLTGAGTIQVSDLTSVEGKAFISHTQAGATAITYG
jgi:hypothetical protein